MSDTREDIQEPTADEIERVADALSGMPEWAAEYHARLPYWRSKALAAILAMGRRAEVACDVMTMHTSSGLPDYFARVTVGHRSLDFFMSKIKGQAEYHAAELDWLLNGAEKPDILGFDYTEPAGLADYLAARASLPAPAVAVPDGWTIVPIAPTREMSGIGAEVSEGLDEVRPSTAVAIFRAMCAVAPTPPAAEAPGQEPVAWLIPGDDTARDNGFIDAMAWREGEFTKPVYSAPPTYADAEAMGLDIELVPDERLEWFVGPGMPTSAEVHDMAVELINRRITARKAAIRSLTAPAKEQGQ